MTTCSKRLQVKGVNMWGRFMARHTTRTLALAICIGVVLGGSIPELGNIRAYFLWGQDIKPHFFNSYFLVVGILGIIICGIACYRRLLQSAPNRMVKK